MDLNTHGNSLCMRKGKMQSFDTKNVVKTKWFQLQYLKGLQQFTAAANLFKAYMI